MVRRWLECQKRYDSQQTVTIRKKCQQGEGAGGAQPQEMKPARSLSVGRTRCPSSPVFWGLSSKIDMQVLSARCLHETMGQCCPTFKSHGICQRDIYVPHFSNKLAMLSCSNLSHILSNPFRSLDKQSVSVLFKKNIYELTK